MSKEYQNRQDRPIVNPFVLAIKPNPLTRTIPVIHIKISDPEDFTKPFTYDTVMTEMAIKCGWCSKEICSYDDLREYMNTCGCVTECCVKCFDACHKESK